MICDAKTPDKLSKPLKDAIGNSGNVYQLKKVEPVYIKGSLEIS